MSTATFRNPAPTVDLVLLVGATDGEADPPGVVLVRRRNPPSGWALPGGFVDEGETVEEAAIREGLEETGLRARLQRLLYVYSNPDRDRRRHTLSVVFIATASGVPVGMDDAAEARIFTVDEIRALAGGAPGPGGLPLAFDHAVILSDWLRWREEGRLPSPGDGVRR